MRSWKVYLKQNKTKPTKHENLGGETFRVLNISMQ